MGGPGRSYQLTISTLQLRKVTWISSALSVGKVHCIASHPSNPIQRMLSMHPLGRKVPFILRCTYLRLPASPAYLTYLTYCTVRIPPCREHETCPPLIDLDQPLPSVDHFIKHVTSSFHPSCLPLLSFFCPSISAPSTYHILSPIQIGISSNTDLILDNRASLYINTRSFTIKPTSISYYLLGPIGSGSRSKPAPPKSKPRERSSPVRGSISSNHFHFRAEPTLPCLF